MAAESLESGESVEIFSADDEKLKTFAEVIANGSGGEILRLLDGRERTAGEIAEETGSSLQLVKYHLKKMQSVDLVRVSRIGANSKSRKMNYYTASKFAVVVTHAGATEKARKSGALVRSIRRVLGACGAAAASLFAAMAGSESARWPAVHWPSSGQAELRIGSAGSVDESLYMALKKVELVASNPSAGSGTPYLDPYAAALPFNFGDLAAIMIALAGIAAFVSLPLFLRCRGNGRVRA